MRKFKGIIFLILISLFANNLSFSQKIDSLNAEKTLAKHRKSVRTSMLCSAIVPGLGQIVNKKYWKVPVLYVGMGALVYFIADNNDTYQYYKDLYATIDLPGPAYFYDDRFKSYSSEELKTIFQRYKDNFRRYRDLCAIGLIVVYVANIIDASVDAHFKYFNVSQNLAINIEPAFFYHNPSNLKANNALGLKLVVNF
jgi:hypothetical protein